MRTRQKLTPPIIPRRMRFNREMFETFGLTAQCLGCRAIRTGNPANHTERCRERTEQELEEEPVGASKVAPDRESSEPGTRSEPETRESRILINGQIARSSKELACQALVMVLEMSRHHAHLNRVPVLTSFRENRSLMRS